MSGSIVTVMKITGLMTACAGVVMIAAALGGPDAARAAAPAVAPSFTVKGDFDAVAASSAGNAWAVGYAGADPALASSTLIAHWNGKTWKRVPSPSPGRQGMLSAVAVRSASLAWAVGSYISSKGQNTLILRWNGRTWARVSSPSPAVLNSLTAVAVLSATDAWAAGTGENDNGDVAASRPARSAGSPPPAIDLVLHWNGKRWQRVPSSAPPPSGDNLAGLAALSSRDAWLAGTRNSEDPATLTEHWNGKRWTRVPSPDPGKLPVLDAVAAVASREVWAAGAAGKGSGQHPLILRWNGKKWTAAKTPAASGGSLGGLAVTSARNAWAVGAANSGALILRWNGSAWRRAVSPSPRSRFLQGVAATSARNAWAVGASITGGTSRTLIEHWNGKSWS